MLIPIIVGLALTYTLLMLATIMLGSHMKNRIVPEGRLCYQGSGTYGTAHYEYEVKYTTDQRADRTFWTVIQSLSILWPLELVFGIGYWIVVSITIGIIWLINFSGKRTAEVRERKLRAVIEGKRANASVRLNLDGVDREQKKKIQAEIAAYDHALQDKKIYVYDR